MTNIGYIAYSNFSLSTLTEGSPGQASAFIFVIEAKAFLQSFGQVFSVSHKIQFSFPYPVIWKHPTLSEALGLKDKIFIDPKTNVSVLVFV